MLNTLQHTEIVIELEYNIYLTISFNDCGCCEINAQEDNLDFINYSEDRNNELMKGFNITGKYYIKDVIAKLEELEQKEYSYWSWNCNHFSEEFYVKLKEEFSH